MRKSLSLTVVLALVLLTASVASAQSFSVFGGMGYGSMTHSLKVSNVENGSSGSAMVLQVAGVFNVTGNFGVGLLVDRVAANSTQVNPRLLVLPDQSTLSTSYALTGLNAIAVYGFDVAGIDVDVFGGVGSYGYADSEEITITDGVTKASVVLNMKTDRRALGYIGGAQVKAPVVSDLYLTGTVAYRSVRWSEGKLNVSLREVYEDPFDKYQSYDEAEVKFQSLGFGGWSLGLGLSYEF